MAHEHKDEHRNDFSEEKKAFDKMLEILSNNYGKGTSKVMRGVLGALTRGVVVEARLDVAAFMQSAEVLKDFYERILLSTAREDFEVETTRQKLAFFMEKVLEIQDLLTQPQGLQITQNLHAKRDESKNLRGELQTLLEKFLPDLQFIAAAPDGSTKAEKNARTGQQLESLKKHAEELADHLQKLEIRLEESNLMRIAKMNEKNEQHIERIKNAILEIVREEIQQGKSHTYSGELLAQFSSIAMDSEDAYLSESIRSAMANIMSDQKLFEESIVEQKKATEGAHANLEAVSLAAQKELKTAREKMEEANKAVEEAEANITGLKERVISADKKVVDTEKRALEIQKEIEDAPKYLQTLAAETEKARIEMEAAHLSVEEAEKHMAAAGERVGAATLEVAKAEDAKTKAEGALEIAVQKLETANLAAKGGIIDRARGEQPEKAKTRHDDAEKFVSETKEKLAAAIAELKLAQTTLQKWGAALETAKETYQDAEETYKAAQKIFQAQEGFESGQKESRAKRLAEATQEKSAAQQWERTEKTSLEAAQKVLEQTTKIAEETQGQYASALTKATEATQKKYDAGVKNLAQALQGGVAAEMSEASLAKQKEALHASQEETEVRALVTLSGLCTSATTALKTLSPGLSFPHVMQLEEEVENRSLSLAGKLKGSRSNSREGSMGQNPHGFLPAPHAAAAVDANVAGLPQQQQNDAKLIAEL